MKSTPFAYGSIVVLGVLALSGCSIPASGVGATSTPHASPKREASFDMLTAAMPSDAQLPPGFRVERRCPGGNRCTSAPGSESTTVEALEAGYPDAWIVPKFYLNATHYDSVADAQSALTDSQKDADQHTGEFDIPVVNNGSTFRPGERGTGTARKFTVHGWQGIETTMTLAYSGVGDLQPTEPWQSTRITVRNDANLLRCHLDSVAVKDSGIVRKICESALEDYLTRLE